MKWQRFFVDLDFSGDIFTLADPGLINQLKNVLRLKAGDRAVFSNGRGSEVLASLLSFKSEGVVFRVVEHQTNKVEPVNKVTLYCSILKRENFELVVQKAVECGVKKIVPVISARTIKTGLKTERLKKIIKEASEQSGRSVIPQLSETKTFTEAVSTASAGGLNLFFDPGGEKLDSCFNDNDQIGIFIGPEGGWTPEERDLAARSSFRTVKLGELTLRGETAAIIASYLAVNH